MAGIRRHRKPRPRSVASTGSDMSTTERRVVEQLLRTYHIERLRHQHDHEMPTEAELQRRVDRELAHPLSEPAADNVEVLMTTAQRTRPWLGLARQVISERADPESFIRAQFETLPPNGRPPYPDQMRGPRAWARYKQWLKHLDWRVRSAFRIQSNAAQQAISWHRSMGQCDSQTAWYRALLDHNVEMSALFRYCLARDIHASTQDERFRRIMQRMETAAAMQYIRSADAYDKVWGQRWIPTGFRDQAQAIYEGQFPER